MEAEAGDGEALLAALGVTAQSTEAVERLVLEEVRARRGCVWAAWGAACGQQEAWGPSWRARSWARDCEAGEAHVLHAAASCTPMQHICTPVRIGTSPMHIHASMRVQALLPGHEGELAADEDGSCTLGALDALHAAAAANGGALPEGAAAQARARLRAVQGEMGAVRAALEGQQQAARERAAHARQHAQEGGAQAGEAAQERQLRELFDESSDESSSGGEGGGEEGAGQEQEGPGGCARTGRPGRGAHDAQ